MAGTYKVNGDKLTGLTVYSTLPIGTVIATVSEHEVGFLAFDGNEYNGADYPELYEKVKNLTAFQSETEGYFKLPNLAGRTIQQAENELGVLVEAGLPNIKGGAGVNNDINQPSEHINGAFSYQQGNKGCSDSGTGLVLTFDASRSNPIYSDDCDTVQPPAFTVNWIIKAVDYVSLPQNAIDDEHTTTGNVHSAAKTSNEIKNRTSLDWSRAEETVATDLNENTFTATEDGVLFWDLTGGNNQFAYVQINNIFITKSIPTGSSYISSTNGSVMISQGDIVKWKEGIVISSNVSLHKIIFVPYKSN